MIQFLQINLHCSRAAQDLMCQSAAEDEIDYIFASEYNTVGAQHWYPDSSGKAAILCHQNRLINNAGQGENGFRWIESGDITLYSCYWSPNTTLQEYEQFLTRLERSVRGKSTEIIIAGDFNAWHTSWGSRSSNRRGEALIDLITSLGLVICNRGNSPTFQRGNLESIVDITLASPRLAANIKDWKVKNATTLSDHNYITFTLESSTTSPQIRTRRLKLDYRKLEESLEAGALSISSTLDAENCATTFAALIKETCGTETTTIPSKRKSVYWWTPALSTLRKTANHTRRVYQRKKRRDGPEDCAVELNSMKAAKLELVKAIKNAKERCWKILCDEVERDPWGKPYKLVMGKLTRSRPAVELQQPGVLQTVVNGLFPGHPQRDRYNWPRESAPNITLEELSRAAKSMKNNTSPGIDGITNEALKRIVSRQPEILLQLYNQCLEEGHFPRVWKRSRLVLIKKGDKPAGEPSSYRPLCLLDCTGKLFEKILDNRLRDILESSAQDGLSDNQYGFRRGRSTIDATNQVCKFVNEAGSNHKVGMLTLDIKNAFNSAPWEKILDAMIYKELPPYLCEIIDHYFTDRTLHFLEPSGAETTINLSSGVPQGSVLGPTLWNILYDGLLNLRLPSGATFLAFADDVAIIARAKETWDLKEVLETAAEITRKWLQTVGLNLALQKSEAMVITNRRHHNQLTIDISGTQINAGQNLKYLGLQFDQKLSFTEHAKLTAAKANTAVQKLSRILPNISATKQAKRTLLSSVVHSLLLYGAPIWAERMSQRGMTELAKVQRRIALRVACAYRTTSTDAVLVVTGTTPIDLLAIRRKAMYDQRQNLELQNTLTETENTIAITWQSRWDNSSKGRWTHKLIKDIKKWKNRKHGSLNYWLTQALTGHGCFGYYLHKHGKLASAECWFCGHHTDDALHTLFVCDAWETRRTRVETLTGMTLSPDCMTELMLRDAGTWNTISSFIQDVLQKKTEEERRRQQAGE